MRKALLSILVVSFFFLFACTEFMEDYSSLYAQDDFFQSSKDLIEKKELALAKKQKILILVSKVGCQWCEKLNKDIKSNGKIIELIKSSYVFIKVDRSEVDGTQFDSDVFPTTYVYNPKEEKTENEIYGYLPPERFILQIKN